MAITLIMMAAVVKLFDTMGRSVNDSRATIEMASRLRNTRNRLQMDLADTTCPTLPWTRLEAGTGYFEYVEGAHTDLNPTQINLVPGVSLVPTNAAGTYAPPNGLGDYDDILMFTVRSRGEPFVGRGVLPNGKAGLIESPIAEVIWYAVENPDVAPSDPRYLGEPGMRTVYRRVLLVAPWVNLTPTPQGSGLGYYSLFDVSSRVEGSKRVANTLADLTKRENRFAHRSAANRFPSPNRFPFPIDLSAIAPANPMTASLTPLRPLGRQFYPAAPPDMPKRIGEDVMLTNVIAWDVRAYDPTAPLFDDGTGTGTVVAPGDPAWQAAAATGNPPAGYGAYVDLGYFPAAPPQTPLSVFSNINPELRPQPPASLTAGFNSTGNLAGIPSASYDTWSFHYEHNGIDEDQPLGAWHVGIDQGTNGFDDDDANGVDDVDERETSPPYPVPLRGIEVRIRVYESGSRQIRQVAVRQSFVPE